MATDALAAGFQETFWIDADIEFHPDAIERLRSYNLPIVSGVYTDGVRLTLCTIRLAIRRA